jgi:hypothetical protein
MTTKNALIDRPIPSASKTGNAPNAAAPDSEPSKKALWTGRILSGLAVLFLLWDATMKVLQHPMAMQGTKQAGYPESVVLYLGIVQLVCLVLYLVPRTSVLGAILWTGYLGGAVASHVRIGDPLFSHALFPVYVGALLWLGLWLREPRLHAVLPLRATK